MKRYTEKQVVPVIGLYTIDADRGFRQFSSVSSLVIELMLHSLNIGDVRFRIVPVVVDKEHEVPIDWCDDRKATGYTGHAEQSLFEPFTFNNQYPQATYGQTSTDCDRLWRLAPKEGVTLSDIGGIEKLNNDRIPHHYTQLSVFMDELYQLVKESKELSDQAEFLLIRITNNIEAFHKDWAVELVDRNLEDFKWQEYRITVN